uniref:ASCH domain-containing protein n=1 Tax=viral metagenome TaxID=1070528 RepID=A0A6C0BDC4_9ZZZZ
MTTNLKKNLQDKYFDLIKSGAKTIEGRLKKGDFVSLKVGDLITFFNKDHDEIVVVIKEIKHYSNFVEFLEENLNDALPGIDNLEDGIMIYREIYTEENENLYGVIAISFEIIKDYISPTIRGDLKI